jgi:hypothetical protein
LNAGMQKLTPKFDDICSQPGCPAGLVVLFLSHI